MSVPAKDLAGGFCLLVLIYPCMFLVFTKICMPPCRRLPNLGSNVVDGVGTLRLKGGGLAGVGEVASARLFPGLRRLPWQDSCRGKPTLSLCSSHLWLGDALVVLRLRFLCPAKRGHRRAAATAHAQLKGYKKDPYFCTLTVPGNLAIHDGHS